MNQEEHMEKEPTKLEHALANLMQDRGYDSCVIEGILEGFVDPELQATLLGWMLTREWTEEEAVGQVAKLLVSKEFGAQGTRYFVRDRCPHRKIMVQDGVVYRLGFWKEIQTWGFKPSDCYEIVYNIFRLGAGEEPGSAWREMAERDFYDLWYAEWCLFDVASTMDRLGTRMFKILAPDDEGNPSPRKLRACLNDCQKLLDNHAKATAFCHAENSLLNQIILRELHGFCESLKSGSLR